MDTVCKQTNKPHSKKNINQTYKLQLIKKNIKSKTDNKHLILQINKVTDKKLIIAPQQNNFQRKPFYYNKINQT